LENHGREVKIKREQLPDQLCNGLKVVFVGTAAGRRSAESGTYYAHPGNRFWPTLFEVGLTPRVFKPHEYHDLLPLGLGFTDLSKIASGMDHGLKSSDFDCKLFGEKLSRFKPRAIAFTSKTAASVWFGQKTPQISLGRQSDRKPNFPEIFVLPSPSGVAVRYWTLTPWCELGSWFRSADSAL
jgi:TDG/mug DNA glycosylase family protein